MGSKVVVYCVVAAILGIIAAATGFAAEATKVKASEIYIVSGMCIYPNSPAFALGIVSAVFTIITRIYISVSFGGTGFCRTDPNSTPMSQLLFVFSWVASVQGVALLFTAAAVGLNNRQVHTSDYILCYFVKPGIFAAGASLALLSVVFGIAAYITLTRPSQTTTNPVAYPMGDVLQQYSPEQYPPQQYAPQQYVPQQFYPPQK